MAGRSSEAFSEGLKELIGWSYEEMLRCAEGDNQDLPIPDIEASESAIVEEPKHQPHLISFSAFPGMLEQDWEQTNLGGYPKIPESVMPRAMTRKLLIRAYRDVRESPYDPDVWINRAGTLLGMGYGELAIADAYRGWLLTENLMNRTVISADGGNISRKAFSAVAKWMPQLEGYSKAQLCQQSFWNSRNQANLLMAQGLYSIQAWHDAAEVIGAALNEMPGNAVFLRLRAMVETDMQSLKTRQRLNPRGMDEAAIARTVKRGSVRRIAYPWIVPNELTRGANAINNLKAKFKCASSNAVVASSSIGGVSKDNFGVLAKLDIRKGQRIVLDRSIFCDYNIPGGDYCGACCEPLTAECVTISCCQTRFCSEDCKGRALSNYHRTICGKDFAWMYDEREDVDYHNDTIPLVMLKILATAVQQKIKPLSLPCVATLTAGYGSDRISFFKFRDNIITPNKILQKLGVDIFANLHFDSWVLQTLFLRIENNMGGSTLGKRTAIGIHPLFSMFNHDCNPSARWGPQNDLLAAGGPIVVTAIRDIKAKEEITVSYVERHLPENIRRGRLRVQIGKICKCDGCLRRRAGEEDGRSWDLDIMDMMMMGLGVSSATGPQPDTPTIASMIGAGLGSDSAPNIALMMDTMGLGAAPNCQASAAKGKGRLNSGLNR